MNELGKFALFLASDEVVERRKGTILLHTGLIRRLLILFPTLDKLAVVAYLYGLKMEGARGGYLNTLVTSLHLYGKFANRPDLIAIKRFKKNTKEKATLSDKEIEQFLALPPSRGGRAMAKNYAAWTLFFSIMAFTGMRPGEVARLTVDDVDFGRGVFVLPKAMTKTNTDRLVPIPPQLTESLRRRVSEHEHYIFPSRRGGHRRGQEQVWDDVDWGYNFHARCKRLGIKRKNLTVYSLRHSLITRLLGEDISLFKVQKLVGHKRIETTVGYTHMVTKDLQDAIKKDPLSRNSISVYDKMRMIIDGVKSFSLHTDKRITYVLNESDEGFELSVRIKKDLQIK